ncbi:GUN4 domain-containing protein [Nostoc sp. C057]|uniref:GUN4 domain-containing protein n=1 Tax=Nostoc sp. C057 TaxID=2576903 RepID=UPI002118C400|nr:GUN4 domain-containing protein [Nostoc sp. C057]
MSNQDYYYDVALSFAGEDRKCSEELAQVLKARSIKVFYDKYEEATLWGKNLYTHLSDVYQRKARFCVMFLSQHYRKKLWTNHEREAAQARAFEENKEYILPIRLDNTEIPGILPTIGYIEWSNANSIANLIAEKLKQEISSQRQLDSVNLEDVASEKGIDYPIITTFPAPSDDLSYKKSVDYTRLRKLLQAERWEEADKETLTVMLKAAGREDWLTYESITHFPCTDLLTIDQLWVKYSKSRFGFSVQKRIWESVDRYYGEFGNRVGWRKGWLSKYWIAYSNVTFNTLAPEGHLPAIIQLKEFDYSIFAIQGAASSSVLELTGLLFSRLITCEMIG